MLLQISPKITFYKMKLLYVTIWSRVILHAAFFPNRDFAMNHTITASRPSGYEEVSLMLSSLPLSRAASGMLCSCVYRAESSWNREKCWLVLSLSNLGAMHTNIRHSATSKACSRCHTEYKSVYDNKFIDPYTIYFRFTFRIKNCLSQLSNI